MTCVSSGTISRAGDTRVQTPRSTTSLPDHPAEKQVEPLAGAAGRRPREEVADARPLRHAAIGGTHVGLERTRRERVERRPDVGRRRVVALHEEPARSSRIRAASAAGSGAARRGRCRESTGGRAAPAARVPGRIEVAHERRRVRPHDLEQRFDRVQDAGDPAKRKSGGTEADDLAILRRRGSGGRCARDRCAESG